MRKINVPQSFLILQKWFPLIKEQALQQNLHNYWARGKPQHPSGTSWRTWDRPFRCDRACVRVRAGNSAGLLHCSWLLAGAIVDFLFYLQFVERGRLVKTCGNRSYPSVWAVFLRRLTMEAKIADVTRLFQKFKDAYAKNDVDTSDSILSQIKVLRDTHGSC